MDINSFLDSGNSISVFFDKKKMMQNLSLTEEDFFIKTFWKKWIFASPKENKIFKINTDELLIGDVYFDLENLHQELMKIYDRWEKENPHIQFPNLYIENSKRSSRLSYDRFNKDDNVIFITTEDLKNIEVFKFTICHELGHIKFNYDYKHSFFKTDTFTRIEKEMFPKINFGFIFLQLALFISLFVSFIINKGMNSIEVFFSLFYIALFSFFLAITYFMYKIRIKNHVMEFYADHFSDQMNNGVCLVSAFKGYNHASSLTHPSTKSRQKYIESSKGQNQWTDHLLDHCIQNRNIGPLEYFDFILR